MHDAASGACLVHSISLGFCRSAQCSSSMQKHALLHDASLRVVMSKYKRVSVGHSFLEEDQGLLHLLMG